MQLSSKALEDIIELLENEHLRLSKFSNKNFLQALVDSNGVIKTHNVPRMILLQSEQIVYKSLKKLGYKAESLDDVKNILSSIDIENSNKIDNLEHYEHTKVKYSKSFEGIMLSSFQDIEIVINKLPTIFQKSLCGTGTFFHSSMSVEIPSDITLVGVENPQVVWFIDKYKHLFETDRKYIFLSITEYKTSFQYKWLESFQGEYIHFGDFDLAGINIYLNSIIPRLKQSKSHSYLIPDNVYEIIKDKNYKKDFSNQTRYIEINAKDDINLKKLISFIKEEKLTLEQEELASRCSIFFKT